jgi:phytoene dehydrogenase-like protein
MALDGIVVGSGPNGLAAAVTLAEAGARVLVLEAEPTIGGGTRSAALTLPGIVHDVCAAIHPLAVVSPFFRRQPLAAHGLAWIESPVALAHPFDDGTAAVLARSFADTGESLGRDGRHWRELVAPLADSWEGLGEMLLGPLLRMPRAPVTLARFGWYAARSAQALAAGAFADTRARALFAGLAAHAALPLDRLGSAAIGLVLAALAPVAGWPLVRGGSQRIAEALAARLHSLGGTIQTDTPVDSLATLPPARVVLCDVAPRGLLAIAAGGLPERYRRRLARFRHGPGAFKLDLALAGPVPWKAPECANAATLHLGGTLEEIAAAEAAVWRGEHPERPFVLLAQPSLFDDSRAPVGLHTVWAYCHVPTGSDRDMSAQIEAQIERFAPGFRERVLSRSARSAAALERYNPNYVGGDITGGVNDIVQGFRRPVLRLDPYATPMRGLYLCSASTPPGGGVHGMCGYHAARSALARM